MFRLISLEYMKLKNTRFFWLFTGLFALLLMAVPLFALSLMDFMSDGGPEFGGLKVNDLPFFDFIDIWQNLTYIFKWPAILLAFIPVISMANEFRYGTIKQNVIDGLSRNELILSKILFSGILSILFGILVFLIGIYMGLMYSPVTDMGFIVKHLEFLPAFVLVLFGYQVFCLLVTLLIKKSGITILLLLFYFFAVEALGYGIVKWNYDMAEATSLFPLRGMANIIQNPFPKYALMEVYTGVRFIDVLATIAHISLYTFLSFWVFNKKDIR
jgi:ABC-2 type transport system permease protein